jgi:O-antigen/teichoic acid export membrane protein
MVWLVDYVVVTASLYRVTSANQYDAMVAAQRTLKLVSLLVISLSLVIFSTAPVIVPLLFGTVFTPTVLPLWCLLPGVIMWSMGRSLAPFISYQCGKPWLNTAYASIAFAINIGALFLFIPHFGIVGASLAASVSYAVNFILISWAFIRLSGASVRSTFLPSWEDMASVMKFFAKQLHEKIS